MPKFSDSLLSPMHQFIRQVAKLADFCKGLEILNRSEESGVIINELSPMKDSSLNQRYSHKPLALVSLANIDSMERMIGYKSINAAIRAVKQTPSLDDIYKPFSADKIKNIFKILKDNCERKESTKEVSFAIGTPLYEVERKLIQKTLEEVNGNRTKAAKILGITVKTIRNKLYQYQK